MVGAFKVGRIASQVFALCLRFVFAVRAVLIAVAEPTLHDAASVIAPELLARARAMLAIGLVAAVVAVAVSVAHVHRRNAFEGLLALELYEQHS